MSNESLKGHQQSILEREIQELEAKIATEESGTPAIAAPAEPTPAISEQTAPSVVPEAVQTEVPPASPEVPAEKNFEQEIERLKKEAETWKKRKADADKHLTPVQQENADLKKRMEAMASSEALEEMKAQVRELKEMLVTMQQKPSAPAAEIDIDPEFAETYPDIAAKLRETAAKVEQRLRNEYEGKFKEFDTKVSASEKQAEEAKARAYAEMHFAEVKRHHADIEDFISDKYGPALSVWAETQAPIVAAVVANPLQFTPKDVAHVVSMFKTATGYKQPKAPALGDLAVKLNAPSSVAEPVQEDVLTDEEFNNFDELSRRFSRDPKKMEELGRKLDNYIAKRRN